MIIPAAYDKSLLEIMPVAFDSVSGMSRLSRKGYNPTHKLNRIRFFIGQLSFDTDEGVTYNS